jgi:hypothetical protein
MAYTHILCFNVCIKVFDGSAVESFFAQRILNHKETVPFWWYVWYGAQRTRKILQRGPFNSHKFNATDVQIFKLRFNIKIFIIHEANT